MKEKKLKSHIYYKQRRDYRILNSRKTVIFSDEQDTHEWGKNSFCGLPGYYELHPKMEDIEDIGRNWFDINICKSCLRNYHVKRYTPNLFLKYKNTHLVVDKIKSLAERSIDLKYIY